MAWIASGRPNPDGQTRQPRFTSPAASWCRSLGVVAVLCLAIVHSRLTCAIAAADCSAVSPGPPTDVTVIALDTKVVVSWKAPANGGCVDRYVVTAVDANNNTVQTSATSALTTTLQGLDNSQQYTFNVQAYAGQFRSVGSSASTASATATPGSSSCVGSAVAAPPLNLRAESGDSLVQLCWDGVSNNACVDTYRVKVAAIGNDGSFRGAPPTSTGACVNVSQLVNGQQYIFTVTPHSNANGDGEAATVRAFAGAGQQSANGWSCMSLPGCSPSAAYGPCVLMGCQRVASTGLCGTGQQVNLDYVSKQITQWCGDACTCNVQTAQPFGWLSSNVSALFSSFTDVANSLVAAQSRGSQGPSTGSAWLTGDPPSSDTSSTLPFGGRGVNAVDTWLQSGQLGTMYGTVTDSIVSNAVNGAVKGAVAPVLAAVDDASAQLPLQGTVVKAASGQVSKYLDQGGIGTIYGGLAGDVVTNAVNQAAQNGFSQLTNLIQSG